MSKAFRSNAIVELPLTFSGATDLLPHDPKPLRARVCGGLHLPARRARILFQGFLLIAIFSAGSLQSTFAQAEVELELMTIIVTGEKMGRDLQETSTSVSVQTADDIEAKGDTSLNDLLRRVPNTAGQEEGILSIRGIAQGSSLGGLGAPLISVQMDGVTLDDLSQQGALVDLFDVQAAEVLRGAQSTSQGRNALAGAVVISSMDPTPYWDLRVRVQEGQRIGPNLAIAGGGPISDSWSFRLAGSQTRDDGDITHLPDGHRDFARKDSSLLRGKLLYAPVSWPGFKSLLTVGGDSNQGQPDFNIERGTAGSDPAQRRTSTVNEATGDFIHSRSASWKNTLELGDSAMLTATTSLMRSQQDYLRDYDGLEEASGGRNDIYSSGRNLAQELRLNFSDEAWGRALIGLYGGTFDDNYLSLSRDVTTTADTALPVPLPVVGSLIEISLDFDSEIIQKARNAAIFAEADFLLPWNLTATLGLRYDQETLDSRTRFTTSRADASIATPLGLQTVPLAGATLQQLAAALPGLDVLPILGAGGIAPDTGGLQGGETTYSALLPKLGLRYAFDPETSLGLTYSEAYRAGGVDVDTSDGQVLPFDPEYTRNYEISLRSLLPRMNAEVALNVFYIDWRDQQVPVLRGLFFVTQNAGRSKLQGGEAAVKWTPFGGLQLDAAVGAVQTEYLEYRDGGIDYAGKEFIFAPRFTSSIGAVWRGEGGWVAGVNYATQNSSFTTHANAPDERSEARQLLDARVGWSGRQYAVHVSGRNLLDDEYVTETYQFREGYIGGASPRGYASYGTPRRFGVQLEARF